MSTREGPREKYTWADSHLAESGLGRKACFRTSVPTLAGSSDLWLMWPVDIISAALFSRRIIPSAILRKDTRAAASSPVRNPLKVRLLHYEMESLEPDERARFEKEYVYKVIPLWLHRQQQNRVKQDRCSYTRPCIHNQKVSARQWMNCNHESRRYLERLPKGFLLRQEQRHNLLWPKTDGAVCYDWQPVPEFLGRPLCKHNKQIPFHLTEQERSSSL